MMDEENGTKKLLITRKVGQRWTVDFSDDISQRDMNQLRRVLPVLFSRMKRTKRLERAKVERAMVTDTERLKPTKKDMVEKKVMKLVTNVEKSKTVILKELTDGSV